MIGWLWQRISGLALMVLLVIHLGTVRFSPLDYNAFKAQLSSPGWALFNGCLMAVAVSHALSGLWQIGRDYVAEPRHRKALAWILLLAGLAFLALGVAMFL